MTPALQKLLTLTIALAALPEEATEEETDAILDEMDAPWQEARPEERRIVQRLSADLRANITEGHVREFLAKTLGVDPDMVVIKP